MISLLKHVMVDVKNEKSLINKIRKKRFILLYHLIRHIAKLKEINSDSESLKILDVGGTSIFWKKFENTVSNNYGFNISNNDDLSVTILNLNRISEFNTNMKNFSFIIGDGRLIPFLDKSFDLVIAHSVIEHVGDYDNQRKLAGEIARVGKYYFIQTPSYYIPIEPHFLFPYFQLLPRSMKINLAKRIRNMKDRETAKKAVDSIRLLKLNELKSLFPHSVILITEKMFFVPISYILIGGGVLAG